jgi:hypothetical protein
MSRRARRVVGVVVAAVLGACGGADGGSAAFVVVEPDGEAALGDSLRARVAHRVVGDALETAVTLTNVSARAVHLEWGACSVSPRLYRAAGRTGPPAFDWLARRSPAAEDGGMPRVCPAYLALHDLAPGDSLAAGEFRLALPARWVAGDSLPPGRYYAAAWVRLVGTRAEGGLWEDTLTLAGGVVELRR